MITVAGNAEKIRKEPYKCPKDGIHRKKNSGNIRGFWGFKIGKKILYYGNWAYYFNDGMDGYKVFYSFKFKKPSKTRDEARVTFDMMKELKDFCPKVYEIIEVQTDIRRKDRHFKGASPAIMMAHVFYPEKTWKNFAKGRPYDWDAVDHPDHSPKGFIRFREELQFVTGKIDYNFDHFSIGNIVWCRVDKRWYLVDVR